MQRDRGRARRILADEIVAHAHIVKGETIAANGYVELFEATGDRNYLQLAKLAADSADVHSYFGHAKREILESHDADT